ncbi:hypothetical protein FACS1894200_10410 [Spirochaetia bacterium]|nr:hypothetical protein FACS1894200_10410 [Spirochaetia bacterium]
MGANPQYKDSMFVHLFREESAVRELYNALAGKHYNNRFSITINTLQNVLYRGIKNDLSFLIDSRLIVLVEHQSSINPNMPIRFLLYLALLYSSLVDNRNFHRHGLFKIPRPEFLVLFNGQETQKEKWELTLSNAFMDMPSAFGGSLELVVPVWNINVGFNADKVAASPLLQGYSIFVAKVREYELLMPREDAILAAADYCVGKDILAEYLKKYRKEVQSMLLNELTNDDAVAAAREDGREEGREEGQEVGQELFANRMCELVSKGYSSNQLQ